MYILRRWSVRLTLLCMVVLGSSRSYAQKEFKIFLVGDAGDHTDAKETLINLQKELNSSPNSAVIFMGDNSYKDVLGGVIPFGYKGFDSTSNTREKINSQLSMLDKYQGSAYFIPGNHDWWNRITYEKGKPKLAMEEHYIEEKLKNNTSIANPGNVFLPKNGGYGPEYADLNDHTIRIVFIDTYRIIQTGIRKGKIPDEEKTFYSRLDSIIGEGAALKEKIFVVAHHPVHAAGPFNRTMSHPYFLRRIKASMAGFPSYAIMSQRINEILRKYPGIYYASGHVHALQYFYGKDSIHYIVSGAGSKEKILSQKEINLYNSNLEANEYLLWNSGGFFEVDLKEASTNVFLYYDNGNLKCVAN